MASQIRASNICRMNFAGRPPARVNISQLSRILPANNDGLVLLDGSPTKARILARTSHSFRFGVARAHGVARTYGCNIEDEGTYDVV